MGIVLSPPAVNLFSAIFNYTFFKAPAYHLDTPFNVDVIKDGPLVDRSSAPLRLPRAPPR